MIKKKAVKGYLEKGLVEFHNLYTRHEELVEEMKRRSYNHYSEVDEKWKLVEKVGTIDKEKNVAELVNRCQKCKRRHSKFMNHQFVEVNASG